MLVSFLFINRMCEMVSFAVNFQETVNLFIDSDVIIIKGTEFYFFVRANGVLGYGPEI